MRCISTLTNWTLLINIILISYVIFWTIIKRSKNPNKAPLPNFLIVSLITILLFVGVAGNILIKNHVKLIADTCGTTPDLLHRVNNPLHTILPVCFGMCWLIYLYIYRTPTRPLLSIIVLLTYGAIYYILMRLSLTTDYGLSPQQYIPYMIAYSILSVVFPYVMKYLVQ